MLPLSAIALALPTVRTSLEIEALKRCISMGRDNSAIRRSGPHRWRARLPSTSRRLHLSRSSERVDRVAGALRESLDRRRIPVTRRSRRSSRRPRHPTTEVDMATIENATDIHPFHVDVPEEELADLRSRIAATMCWFRRCPATGSRGNQRLPAGTLSTSRTPGSS
jgi:hypothetical protein